MSCNVSILIVAYIGLSLTFDQESDHAQSSSSAAIARVQPHAYSRYDDAGGDNINSGSSISSSNSNTWLGAFGVIRQAFGYGYGQGQGQESGQLSVARPLSLSSTAMSGRTSILGSINSESGGQSNQSTLPVPSPTGVDGSRLSEFYEAYYRNSNVGSAASVASGGPTLDGQLVTKKGDSSATSPLFSKVPGAAF